MKECILNVHLVEIPTTNGGNSKKTSKSGELGHGSKSFSIVNTFTLSEAFGNKASFVMFNSAIRIILDLVDPSAPNRTMTRRKRDHGPSVISLKGTNLRFHSMDPLGILASLLISFWFDKISNGIDEGTMSKRKIAIRHIP